MWEGLREFTLERQIPEAESMQLAITTCSGFGLPDSTSYTYLCLTRLPLHRPSNWWSNSQTWACLIASAHPGLAYISTGFFPCFIRGSAQMSAWQTRLSWLLCSYPLLLLLGHSVLPDFESPRTTAHQASLSSPSPRVCSNSCPLSGCCHSTLSSSVSPFSSCPQSLSYFIFLHSTLFFYLDMLNGWASQVAQR